MEPNAGQVRLAVEGERGGSGQVGFAVVRAGAYAWKREESGSTGITAPVGADPLAEIRNPGRGGHTLRGIAATLNSRDHRTRRGWNRSSEC